MPVDVKLWNPTFSTDGFPPWPCPKCEHGRLVGPDKPVKIREPAYSQGNHSHEAFEPDWVVARFGAVLTCSDKKCGEYVYVIGETEIEEVYYEEYGNGYETQLRPRALFPAPPIIVIDPETLKAVRDEIEAAFGLFWSDAGACASRLRTSVERILDDAGIPKTRKKSSGGRTFLRLVERIAQYEAKHKANADVFTALRHVGNLGTHESSLDRQPLLAGFDIYEHALSEIYGKRSKKVAAMAKKLKKGKGKLK